MGPRPFGRGDCCCECSPWAEFELQWGRGLSAAETGPMYRRYFVCRASMGPRPFGRGDIRAKYDAAQTTKLQWGRGLSAAETPMPVRFASS